MESKLKGVLFSGIFGDAMGVPVELWTSEFIEKKCGTMYLENFIKTHKNDFIGQYSDDSEMTIATIDSINEVFHIISDNLLKHFKLNFTNNRGYSPRIETLLKSDIKIQDNKKYNSNGGLMRIAPVILWTLNEDILYKKKYIYDALSVTNHIHPESIVSCNLLSCIIYEMLKNPSLNNLINTLKDKKNFDNDDIFFSEIDVIINNYISGGDEKTIIQNYEIYSTNAKITLLKAINSVIFNFNNPHTIISHVISYGGDTDTTALVAGNIVGCIYGYQWINELHKIENINSIEQKIDKFVSNIIKKNKELNKIINSIIYD